MGSHPNRGENPKGRLGSGAGQLAYFILKGLIACSAQLTQMGYGMMRKDGFTTEMAMPWTTVEVVRNAWLLDLWPTIGSIIFEAGWI